MRKSVIAQTWSTTQNGELDALLHSESPRMREVLEEIRSVAPTKTTVLLTGETGTGKGLMARLIHHLSSRKEAPFVAIHSGAVPETLLESELFGHEKGAFTGAIRRKLGKFELAEGGTLFLDEVGTITPSAQVKLLRVLQEHAIQRVGGEEEIDVDIRLVAATNSDIAAMEAAGTFRSDLFYRLNIFPIHLPSLRERAQDLPALVQILLARLGAVHARAIDSVNEEVLAAFLAYSWPGNIRELENILERALILEKTGQIMPESIPMQVMNAGTTFAAVPVDGNRSLAEVRREVLESAERRYLTELLRLHGGKIGESAGTARITPRQLHNLLRRHGIRKEAFKPPRPDR